MVPLLFLLFFGYILSIPGCPQKCFCIRSLTDCQHANLDEVPPDFDQKTETLILNENCLHLIPRGAFQNFQNLTFLGLAHNKLSLQNDSFEDISNSILSLDLSGNSFTDLPSKLFKNTKKLVWLNLANNRLDLLDINIFSSLEKLTYLDLSNNRLQKLTSMFVGLSQLDTLMLASNYLHTIPQGVFDSTPKLKILDLSHNKISHLPKCLFNSTMNLNDLLLDDNNFTVIPRAVFTVFHNLEHFSISKNRIQNVLPFVFVSKLRKLDLSNNLLSVLPCDFLSGLKQLEVLNLSLNCFGKFPSNLFINNTKLAFLHLDKTCLSTLPIVSGLRNMSELTLCCNAIKSLARKFTDNMVNLKLLDLSNNNITKIEDGALKMNPNLTKVVLTGNPVFTTERINYTFKGSD
ncbi:insulin-like growth factor-binding protein complex acid labile subunit [Alligator mississippiensis]|uniref:insulin-like growth factor-binding protein complex acid labile subunit n=1 Tax=Alligator mississippiensis TaxID=8496 RepID=UPI0003D0D903|nr:insulin-like growth factor-binding protein complex acid labile subunit [Alligator mississippiensis]